MHFSVVALLPLALAFKAAATPVMQLPFTSVKTSATTHDLASAPTDDLSEWSRAVKEEFVAALLNNSAQDWTLVLGNEGGDLDSLSAALAYAYHLTHAEQPKKAVALLQTQEQSLDLRPENTLALKHAGMENGHKDLLSLDDLPYHRDQVARLVGEFVLVDHPRLNTAYGKHGGEKVTGLIDHHRDEGSYPNANPRVVKMVASCSTLTANILLQAGSVQKLPTELVDLLISVIALDSKAFSKGPPEEDMDREVSRQLLPYSSWKGKKLQKVAEKLAKELKKAKKDLGSLSVRDLLARDYKGDIVRSNNQKLSLHLGMASIPISLEDQISRTVTGTATEWFAIESKWTVEELGADISLALTSYKERDENGDKQKRREIVLVVKAGGRLTHEEAVDLFHHVVADIKNSDLPTKPSKIDLGQSGHKRKVWWNLDPKGGRKVVRPIVEDSVTAWLNKKADAL